MSTTTNPLATLAAEANHNAVSAAVSFESAAEALEEAFVASARAFAAARDGKVTVRALAAAVKAEAGDSSVNLHGVTFFASNAAVEAHAYCGRILNLPGSLKDGVSARDLQTLCTQTYNKEGGAKVLAAALKTDDTQEAFDYLKALLKAAPSQKDIVALLKAALGPVSKAAAMAETDGVPAEAIALVAELWTALATIDEHSDKSAAMDEAADLASLDA